MQRRPERRSELRDRSDRAPVLIGEEQELAQLRAPGFGRAASRYTLLRVVILRGLGLVYLVAFLISAQQVRPLVGEHGLLPAAQYLEQVERALGSAGAGFWRLPSVFWLGAGDAALAAAAWSGVLGSLALVGGLANAPLLGVLWVLYLSLCHVGQVFYGYGWESLLCETGFLAIFLAPPLDPRPIPRASPPPEPVIVLLRWLTFRVMFGAGLIKIRGDDCWRDLTCLAYHYETQPNPSPLSYYFHQLPLWVHRIGVLFNHLVELVAPFGVFGPRPLRLIAGALIAAFQLTLIASGNLSFLNWLTLVVALSCFDDGVVLRLFPERWRRRAAALESGAATSRARRIAIAVLCVLVGVLSLNPLVNMLSSRQRMNASFDPFGLVNTYGAFGSVGRVRHEVVLEGTADPVPGPDSAWRAYELPCKPGDVARRPCLITPYHYRLDWQMWFLPLGASSGPPAGRPPPTMKPPPWLIHLVSKLLRNDAPTLALFTENPFPDHPPRFVRAALYRYRFSDTGRPESSATWWLRSYEGEFLPPLSLEDPALSDYLRRRGWKD